MKTLSTLIVTMGIAAQSIFAANPHTTGNEKDTLIIKLKNKNKIMIVTAGSSNLSEVRTYDLNKLLREIDSTLNSEGRELLMMDAEGKIRLKDSTFNIKVFKKSGSTTKEMTTDSAGNLVTVTKINPGSTRTIVVEKSAEKKSCEHQMPQHRTWDRLEFDLGFNNYLQNGTMPDAEGKIYGLNTLRSNIVAIRYMEYISFSKKNRRASVYFGLELASNNYRFEDPNVRALKGITEATFYRDSTDGRNSQKSKLAITWLQIPIGVSFLIAKNLEWNIGGFAGYRLSSHNKIKYSQAGSTRREKDHANFYLNNLQYGLRTSFRYGSDAGIFFQYNGNTLFAKGPELNPFAFGFTLALD
jgi:hypothetical protein